MGEPTTAAGQRLWDILGGSDDGLTVHMILAIEQEAAARAKPPSVSEANRRIVQKALTEQWVVAINNVEAWDLASIVLAALAATEVAG